MAVELLGQSRTLAEAHRLLVEEGIDPMRAAVVLRYARAKAAKAEESPVLPIAKRQVAPAPAVSVFGLVLMVLGVSVLAVSIVGKYYGGIWGGPVLFLLGGRIVYRDLRLPGPLVPAVVARPPMVKAKKKTVVPKLRRVTRGPVRLRAVSRPAGV
jgi:hypothetical protein